MWSGSVATAWWLVAGVLVAAELLTGTFYLLMLALGAASGALAAHAGASLSVQIAVAALGGGAAVAAWHLWRRRRPVLPPAVDAMLQLDIGTEVHVDAWRDDGSTRVQHRGSTWTARLAGPGPALPGRHVIRAVQANQLMLERIVHG